MDVACNVHGRIENVCVILDGKCQYRWPLGGRRLSWEDIVRSKNMN